MKPGKIKLKSKPCRLKADGVPVLRRGHERRPPHLPASYLQLTLVTKEKFVFSSEISLGKLTTLQEGPMPRSSWPTHQHITNSMTFLKTFCFILLVCFCGVCMSLCVFLVVVFFFKLFILFLFVLWNWVGGEVGRIWEELSQQASGIPTSSPTTLK